MDTKIRHDAEARPASARPEPADFTALVLAPRWRLGRRSAAVRTVADTLEALRPLAKRLKVACQGAAAPAFRELRSDDLLIVPDSESPLSTLSCALDACKDDPLLIASAGCEIRPHAIAAMHAALQDPDAGVAAAVDRRGLLEFPLFCRASVRTVVHGCLFMGQTSLAELLRRPCARLVALD